MDEGLIDREAIIVDSENEPQGREEKAILRDIDWLADRLRAIVSCRGRLSRQGRAEIASALEQQSGALAAARGVSLLCRQLGVRASRWYSSPAKRDLPMIAVLPGGESCLVYDVTAGGAWLAENARRRQRYDIWPDGTSFLSLRAAQPTEEALSAWRLFRIIFKKDRAWLFWAAGAALLASSLALATSLYSMQIYDRVIPGGGMETLYVLTGGVMIAIVIEFAIKLSRAVIVNRSIRDIDEQYAIEVFARLLRIRLDQFPASVGNLAQQVRGFEAVRGFATSMAIYLVADAPYALFFLAVIYLLAGPVVAAVPAVAALVAVAAGLYFRNAVREHAQQETVVGNRRHGLLVEAIHGFEMIKGFAGGWWMQGRWNDLSGKTIDETIEIKHISELSGFIGGAIQQLSYVGLVATASWLAVVEQNLTVGSIIACSIISGRILTPVNMLPGLLVQWGHAQIALKNLEGLFALECDNQGQDVPLSPATIRGEYHLENVEFAYPGQPSGLAIERLHVTTGEKVAVLGTIGAGKSTLLKLMAGLCHPERGQVLLDGMDIQQIAADRRCEIVGYLPQQVRLFGGSLYENLVLGLPNISEEEIQAAAEVTGLSRLIASRSDGLGLKISEGGEGISGGQKQLVALTRLMLASPALWLLDEPTSGMDDNTEGRCIEALRRSVLPDQTLVLITHRLRLLSLVQRIVVLTPNGIVLDGPRDDVLAQIRKQASQQGAAQ